MIDLSALIGEIGEVVQIQHKMLKLLMPILDEPRNPCSEPAEESAMESMIRLMLEAELQRRPEVKASDPDSGIGLGPA